MPHRTPKAATRAVDSAVEQVIQDGGVVHEDAMWDANELAIDGASKQSIAERIKSARAERYQPKSGWRVR